MASAKSETQPEFNLLLRQFVTRMNNIKVPDEISNLMEEIAEKKNQLNELRKTHKEKIYAIERDNIKKMLNTGKSPKKMYCVAKRLKLDSQNMVMYINSTSGTLSGAKKYQNQLRTEIEERCRQALDPREVSLGCTLVDCDSPDNKLMSLFVANALPPAFHAPQ